jgi:hypothetical protein
MNYGSVNKCKVAVDVIMNQTCDRQCQPVFHFVQNVTSVPMVCHLRSVSAVGLSGTDATDMAVGRHCQCKTPIWFQELNEIPALKV